MSSEDPGVVGLVVGHGKLAEGLVDAVRTITGVEEGVLLTLSNEGLSTEGLRERIDEVLGDRPVIIFTDLPSGSCATAAHLACADRPGRVVVCGTNLSVLLDFVFNRDLPVAELVPRLLDRGRAAISCTLEAGSRVDPTLSGG